MRWLGLLVVAGCVSDIPIRPDKDGQVGDTDVPDTSMTMEGGKPDAPVMMTDVMIKVTDEYGGPISGAAVQIGNQSATTIGDGSCTLKAPPMYDVLVGYAAQTAVTTKRVIGFNGLTTRTPILEAPIEAARHTSFTITTTGGTYTAGDTVKVLYSPTSRSGSHFHNIVGPNYTWPNYLWVGATPNTGTMYGYLVNLTANGLPNVTAGWKAQSTSSSYTIFDNGNTSPSINLNQSITSGTVSGTLDRSGQVVDELYLDVSPTGGGTGRLVFGGPNFGSGTTFSTRIPSQSTAGVILGGFSNNASIFVWRANIQPGATNVALKLPATVTSLGMPNPNQMGVDYNTNFSWDGPFPLFRFRVFCGSQDPRTFLMEIITAQKSITIPDANGLGAALPTATFCVWQVTSFAGAMTTDDAVKPAGWRRFTSNLEFVQDGGYSTSGRPFTTK